MSEEDKDVSKSRRDAIADAIENVGMEYDPDEDRVPPNKESEQSRPRDEKGRFIANKEDTPAEEETKEKQEDVSQEEYASQEVDSSKEIKPAPEEEKEEQKAEVEDPLSKDELDYQPFPNSWSPQYREDWDKLSKEMKGQILKREQDFHKGIDQYREKASAYDEFEKLAMPYIPALNAASVTPTQAFKNSLDLYYMMLTGDPEAKRHLLVKLGKQFSVDMNELPVEEDNAFTRLSQQVATLQQQLQMQQMQGQVNPQGTSDHYQQMVSEFRQAPGHEHFDELSPVMASLIESGQAQELDDAYQMALRTRSGTWESRLNQERKKWAEEERNRTVKAKAAAVSVKGSKPAPISTSSKASNDIRSALYAAFDNTAN